MDARNQVDVDVLWAKCRAAGLRPSASRLAILKLLCEQSDFKTADEIHAIAQARGVGAPMSSIYRALKDLEYVGIAVRREMGRGRARFGMKTPPNPVFLVSADEMRAIALNDPLIDERLRNLATLLGYELVEREITLVVSVKSKG